jgi:hypothetical protein
LLGAVTAIVTVGICSRTAKLFVNPLSTPRTALAAALLALAAGLVLPRGMVTWLWLRAWKRFVEGGRRSEVACVLVGRVGRDRALYWTVLSIVTLAAGIAIALVPVYIQVSVGIYRSLHVHFVWSDGPLEVVHLGLNVMTGLAPFVLLGLALGCVHHLSAPAGRWDTAATGWWLVGAGGGAWFTKGATGGQPLPDAVFLAGSLPPFLVAVTAAALSAQFPDDDAASDRDQTADLPLWSDHWPRLLRAGIVVVGSIGASVAVVWTTSSRLADVAGPLLPAAVLSSLGLGVLLACRTRRYRVRSVGGFGVAAAVAGITTAIAATSAGRPPPGAGLLPGIACCVCVGSIAYATAYGRKTLLDRVASRASAGSRIMARMLACAALAVWVAVPLLMRLAGPRATLVLFALVLLALGGLLIIHEPGYSNATRRARLAVVFGAVGSMIVVSSLPTNPWRRGRSASLPMQSAGVVEPAGNDTTPRDSIRIADRR